MSLEYAHAWGTALKPPEWWHDWRGPGDQVPGRRAGGGRGGVSASRSTPLDLAYIPQFLKWSKETSQLPHSFPDSTRPLVTPLPPTWPTLTSSHFLCNQCSSWVRCLGGALLLSEAPNSDPPNLCAPYNCPKSREKGEDPEGWTPGTRQIGQAAQPPSCPRFTVPTWSLFVL